MAGKLLDETGLAELWSQVKSLHEPYHAHWWRKTRRKATVTLGAAQEVLIFASNGTSSSYKRTFVSSTEVFVEPYSGDVRMKDPNGVFTYWTEWTLSDYAGKYVRASIYCDSSSNKVGNEIYYIPASASVRPSTDRESGYNAEIYVTAQLVSRDTTGDTVEFLQTASENAYTVGTVEDGGYFVTYEYLGTPFANMVEPAKIATGTYVGTGVYGSVEAATTLMFDFPVKFLFLFSISYMKPYYRPTIENELALVPVGVVAEVHRRFVNDYGGNGDTDWVTCTSGAIGSSNTNSLYCHVSEDGRTVSYYASGSAEAQFNSISTNTNYAYEHGYVAIG